VSLDLPERAVDFAAEILRRHDAAGFRLAGATTGTPDDPTAEAVADAAADPTVRWATETLSQLAADPPPPGSFLLRRLWPADAYGVIAAGSKAGKTWLGLDIAVAVALGRAALGGIEVDRSGPVLVFLGEGGRRNAWRRLQAVCEHYGADPAEVADLHLSYRSPRLSDAESLAAILELVDELRPVLIIVDPLYLAAGGSDGASLYGMALVLEKVQHVATVAGSALIVIHHWNQTGKGSGFSRMSGAGPEEWGRVLWSVDVNRGESPRPDGSLVHLTVSVRGGEVADAAFALTREVWVDDPDDLNSAMHYRLTRGEVVAGGGGRKLNATDRALAVLNRTPGEWLTVAEVQDADAEWSHEQPEYGPLKADTVARGLSEAHEAGRCERQGQGGAGGYRYRKTDGAR
jgi:hypothetical protein